MMDSNFTASQASSCYYPQPSDNKSKPHPWPPGKYAEPPYNITQTSSSSQMMNYQAVQHVQPDLFSSSDSTFDSSYTSMTPQPAWTTDDSSSSLTGNTFYDDGLGPESRAELGPPKVPQNQHHSPTLSRRDQFGNPGAHPVLQQDFGNEPNRFVGGQVLDQHQLSGFSSSSPVQVRQPIREPMSGSGNERLRPNQTTSLPTREDHQRPVKRRRPPSCHSSGHWLSHTMCSLWRRDHFGSLHNSDLYFIQEAFGIAPEEMNATWCALYGDARISRQPTSPNLKPRCMDVFCSVWRLAFLDLTMPSDTQIDALSQILSADKIAVIDWFKNKAATEEGKTSADIEAEAVQKFKVNRQLCLEPEQRNANPSVFKFPVRDPTKPFGCTTGCGESFPEPGRWRKHEEKNWPQKLWCCALPDCSKRKTNKHVFFRPDTFENHLTSSHDDIPAHDIKNIKSRAKRSDFSMFPRECIFSNCDEHFTSWKHRLDHLEYEFRNRNWTTRDWRAWSNNSDDDESMDSDGEDSSHSTSDEKGGFTDEDDGDDSGNDDNGGGGGGHGESKSTKFPSRSRYSSKRHQAENDEEMVDQSSTVGPEHSDPPTSMTSLSIATRNYGPKSRSVSPLRKPEITFGPFEYEKLPSDRHVRLLHLESNVSWRLTSVSLDSNPIYTALSYTWEPNAAAHPIVCNGKLLDIPMNCYEALGSLQHSNFFRRNQTVWVDALCIDSNNDVECQQQGMLMEEIYRRAARAIVWLGKDKSNSAETMNSQSKSISLLTFDDVSGSTVREADWSRRTSETNCSAEDCTDPAASNVLQSLPEDKVSESTKHDNMSSSMHSLALADKVQPFRFQMGYQCFDESAAQVESWLEPESVEPLGQSGSARVDKVSFQNGSHVLARKVIRLSSASQMFFPQEAISMRRLHHPHIVHLVLGYLKGDTLTILMEPAADANLQQYMQSRSASQPPQESNWKWFGCLISGLVYMHDMGLRHRDIKPSNILLKSGEILYADFGLSNDTKIDSSEDSLIGNFTRQYAAPEFAQGYRGKASDVWSLGCVFLELLTVLSGQSITALYTYSLPDGHRKADLAYYKNQQALEKWLDKLDGQFFMGDMQAMPTRKLDFIHVVFLACKDMTRYSPKTRPTARQLAYRLPINACCSTAGSSTVMNQAATSFLQQLHWNVLNFLARPADHDGNDSWHSDLVAIRSIISRLSRRGGAMPVHMDLHEQVRMLSEQIARTWKASHGSSNGSRPTSIDFNVNQTLQQDAATDDNGQSQALWRDIRKRIGELGQLMGPAKMIDQPNQTNTPDTNPAQAAEKLESPKQGRSSDRGMPEKPWKQLKSQDFWNPSDFDLPVAKCSYSYKHNGQLLVGAAWFLYRELGWSLEEALRITVRYDCSQHDACDCSVNSIFSRVCSERYCHSMRKVKKTIEQKKGQKRPSKNCRSGPQRSRAGKLARVAPPPVEPRSDLVQKLRRIGDRFRGFKSEDIEVRRAESETSETSTPRPAGRGFDFRRLYRFGRRRKTVEGA
ncbi:MAG: hypothetical protein MMC23_005191 [Stictis urceolatum]|nr:hypothetical protein [Stictis urceolata]